MDKALVRSMTQMLSDLGAQGAPATYQVLPAAVADAVSCWPVGLWFPGCVAQAMHANAAVASTCAPPFTPPQPPCPASPHWASTVLHPAACPAVYMEDFEAPFLERTSEFYAAEAAEFIASCDCPTYLQHAERRLAEEVDR